MKIVSKLRTLDYFTEEFEISNLHPRGKAKNAYVFIGQMPNGEKATIKFPNPRQMRRMRGREKRANIQLRRAFFNA